MSVAALARAIAQLDHRGDCTPRDRRQAERLERFLTLQGFRIVPAPTDPREPAELMRALERITAAEIAEVLAA